MAIHPRDTIRNDIESALISAGFISSDSIITGGVYGSKKEKLPNILVYLGGENISVLTQNDPRNRMLREVQVYLVVKTENKNRLSAIIEAEDLARNCESALLTPGLLDVNSNLVDITLTSYEVSDPHENSTVFSTQLIFNVKYNDKFTKG